MPLEAGAEEEVEAAEAAAAAAAERVRLIAEPEVGRLQAEAVEALAHGHAARALSQIDAALAIEPAHDMLIALREKVAMEVEAAEPPRELRRRMSKARASQ